MTPDETSTDAQDFQPDSEETVAAIREQCEADKAELQERLLRAQAEFQNFRRRAEKERLELSEYSSMEAVRSILPIIDDFKRALLIESADKEYAKGMELIEQRLTGALQKLGLEPVDATGQPFDPHVHHAVELAETADAPDQTVLA
ncbi:MAG: nucleotide exchange factor GrpE, partial [Acidobacteriota bacterium]